MRLKLKRLFSNISMLTIVVHYFGGYDGHYYSIGVKLFSSDLGSIFYKRDIGVVFFFSFNMYVYINPKL